MSRFLAGFFCAVLLAALAGGYFAMNFDISASPQPGPTITWFAASAVHWLVRRSLPNPPPAEPPNDLPSQAAGQMNYGGNCAGCHGVDGNTPSAYGLQMYPRVPGLGSPQVQSWSNAELFWIINHGIRHSGMPAFEKICSDDSIWDMVHYVRSFSTRQVP
jgi:mono/diheme cytochrome c family protein